MVSQPFEFPSISIHATQVCLGLTITAVVLGCVYAPHNGISLVESVTSTGQCVAQNHAELVTSHVVGDLMDSVQRNADLLRKGTVSWSGVETYASNNPPTSDVYMSSLPAVMLGTQAKALNLVSTFMMKDGSVFSAESVQGSVVGRMYSSVTTECWEASYSTSSGYGAWEPSTKGPLNVGCGTVTTAWWYTRALAMANGATNMTTASISSGNIGITHMVHEETSNTIFGGEMDGITIAQHLAQGKPVQGESYIVSTTNSVETLLASTEDSAQAQLQSVTDVDAGSVGGLTGASASTLRSKFGSFADVWSRSATLEIAESSGQLAKRCAGSQTAYIAIEEHNGAPVSLQQLHLPSADLHLLLVNTIPSHSRKHSYESASYATYALSAVAILIMSLGLVHPFVEYAWAHRWSLQMICFIIFTCTTFIFHGIWSIEYSTSHKDAVDDFLKQLSKSIGSGVSFGYSDAWQMGSQAERIWYFTGAPTSNLSTMNTWTVDMMSDFYSSSPKMAALRFGTTEGLEQAANGTADGIQVLSRNTSAACLVTYLADGITVDAAYPSNCHYDPRYTDWYIPKLQVTDTNGHVHGGKTDTDISYEIEQAR